MATIHHLHRQAGTVRPIADAELSRCMGDPDAAFARNNVVDFERHRVSRIYRRVCAVLDRHPTNLDAWLARDLANDPANWRDGVSPSVRKADNERRFYKANPQFARRIGFEPRIDFIDLAAKAIIVAGLGAAVAMWTVLS